MNDDTMRDEIAGENIAVGNASWTFGGDVAATFSDHVRRSVPLYDTGHDLTAKVSDFFLRDGSVCYEIGCSTGKLINKIAERHANKDIHFVGIDCEQAMIERARVESSKSEMIEFLVDDIVSFDYAPADMFVSYYVIQFIPPRLRQIVFNRVFESLNWGGAFVLFEKVRANDARFQDITTALYTDFKLDQGYTANEIVAKSRSLKGVLEPFSTDANIDMMKRAGFKDTLPLMKYVSFEGFLAVK